MILPPRLPSTGPSGISYTEHRLIGFDETPLFYRRVTPSGPVKAMILLVHGMGEYGARYLPLAEYLAALGIESWVPDLRGFGRSGGRPGHANHFTDLQTDLEGIGLLAHRQRPGAPLFFLGHSFGGLLVSRVAERHAPTLRLRGLVFSSPLFGIAIDVPLWQKALAGIASVVAPTFTQSNRVNPDLLTHDPAIYQAFMQDKLVHFGITSRLYTEITKAMPAGLREAPRIHCPVLVAQAGDDRIVLKENTTLFYNALGSEDKQLEIYDGWYHEILNETGREAVFAKIGQWVIQRI